MKENMTCGESTNCTITMVADCGGAVTHITCGAVLSTGHVEVIG